MPGKSVCTGICNMQDAIFLAIFWQGQREHLGTVGYAIIYCEFIVKCLNLERRTIHRQVWRLCEVFNEINIYFLHSAYLFALSSRGCSPVALSVCSSVVWDNNSHTPRVLPTISLGQPNLTPHCLLSPNTSRLRQEGWGN